MVGCPDTFDHVVYIAQHGRCHHQLLPEYSRFSYSTRLTQTFTHSHTKRLLNDNDECSFVVCLIFFFLHQVNNFVVFEGFFRNRSGKSCVVVSVGNMRPFLFLFVHLAFKSIQSFTSRYEMIFYLPVIHSVTVQGTRFRCDGYEQANVTPYNV